MKLCLVDLLYPFKNWDNIEVQRMYTKLISLKLNGFRYSYENVLPMDKYDLIADHVIVCEETPFGLRPLSSYKILTKERVAEFNLNLPCITLINSLEPSQNSMLALDYMENFINKHNTLYTSSWTTHPNFRGRSEAANKVRELLLVTLYSYMTSYNIPTAIIIGMLELKTDQLFQKVGYQKAKVNGKELGHFLNPYFANQNALALYLTKFSEFYLRVVSKNKEFIEERYIIGEQLETEKKAA